MDRETSYQDICEYANNNFLDYDLLFALKERAY